MGHELNSQVPSDSFRAPNRRYQTMAPAGTARRRLPHTLSPLSLYQRRLASLVSITPAGPSPGPNPAAQQSVVLHAMSSIWMDGCCSYSEKQEQHVHVSAHRTQAAAAITAPDFSNLSLRLTLAKI